MWYLVYRDGGSPVYTVRTLGYLFSATGAITILVHIILFIITILVYRRFGKGLKAMEFVRPGKKSPNPGENEDDSEGDDTDYVEYDDTGDTPEAGGGGGDLTLFDVIRNTYALDRSQKNVVARF